MSVVFLKKRFRKPTVKRLHVHSEREGLDQEKRNVLLSHQFYTDTENASRLRIGAVRRIDNVDIASLLQFDYAVASRAPALRAIAGDSLSATEPF